MADEAENSVVATRLRRMPGIGPVTAMAIETFAPAMANFRRGRDFAAWLGLVPRQHSSGGKQRLGRTSKMGQRDIRRLLIVGAMSGVTWKGPPQFARLVAGPHAGAQAAHARRRRSRQQDGARDLGDDHVRTRLPGTGGGSLLSRNTTTAAGCRDVRSATNRMGT